MNRARSDAAKRLFDLALALLALALALPLMVAITLWVRLDSAGPALFRQQRVGRHGRLFHIHKFRTMRVRSSQAGPLITVAGDARVTRAGRWLRRTKLDELPQLWNVLRGDMSLVGPRPGLFNQQELLQARAAHGVYAARPGITGLAQVSGIDMSTPELLAQTDARMLANLTVAAYFKYIVQTVLGSGRGTDAMRGGGV